MIINQLKFYGEEPKNNGESDQPIKIRKPTLKRSENERCDETIIGDDYPEMRACISSRLSFIISNSLVIGWIARCAGCSC